ncbi:MAG: pyruvate:ferredoxin (flavodoxin) oxidoreductase [Myxococcales bacterium]|nr:pyruvate:ferredoxin (flavodoxin) oxidoreductase [Myxococcales bacterium]
MPPSPHARRIVDGNEAAARVAYLTNEVCAIYPITPASPMGELADAWAAVGQKNIFDTVPDVIEMQSEGGAAGAVHGSLQGGALTTTFTASQGLLLMIPNMFKIAGELTPTVFHIAARSVATHALSIFGDHSDVMAARSTGWGMLASESVQTAQDMAMIAQMATLASRVPFLHFFDGFRTSHEMNVIDVLSREHVRAMVDDAHVRAHRERSLDPDKPSLRGTAQNPDVFFQAREACNPFYLATPDIVRDAMARFADVTGRSYSLFEYHGAPDAERVLVLMGSGVGAAREAVSAMVAKGERVGMVAVRLYRPFDVPAFISALPETVKSVAALDRTKEPGAVGEPLYQDVVTALAEGYAGATMPRVTGGRYGLSSKEFTPAMAASVLAELARDKPKRHFTVGIRDDVTHTSLPWDEGFITEREKGLRAVFYGLGSDGTVGANKNTCKIIGEGTDLYAQGYFVYDSKKAGSVTVSHLRIEPEPIESTYLLQRADFVACHQFNFLERVDVLALARPGATLLLNSPFGPDEVWERIPKETQQQIIDKKIALWVVDAATVAEEAQLGRRINTVMQTCFFKLSEILPVDDAIGRIKSAIEKTYKKRGEAVLARNYAAVDGALRGLSRIEVPREATSKRYRASGVSALGSAGGAEATDFVQKVTSMIIEGRGDLLPVSAMPVDGTFPTGTARFEKRSIAREIPIWNESICIDCGLCAAVCPHTAIRVKAYQPQSRAGAPEGFKHKVWKSKDLPAGTELTVQVAPDDCTGCGVCVEVCPARDKSEAKRKAINMEAKLPHLDVERSSFDFFLGIPQWDRSDVDKLTVKTSQLLEPLFEFSGACAGCGETPYLKTLTQLFGDRMVVANATGCSSIYGGNLPTTPWSVNADGRGPAWNNSLFEDNAEFGLGMRLALDHKRDTAAALLRSLSAKVGDTIVSELIDAVQNDERSIAEQRARVAALESKLAPLVAQGDAQASLLLPLAASLVRRSVWIIGGDGWAYDIGFGGLDHVLASGRDVNILVLDTEVYSNTGGQASKATPRAAVAKFAAKGKPIGKKDLGMIAMAYGNVYVAQVALGAQPKQTIRAFMEAEAYPGTSLIIAYSTCIAHGIDMQRSMGHQKDAVQSGYWPIYRFVPDLEGEGTPFHLDCKKPKLKFADFARDEARFAMLQRSRPQEARELFELAQKDIDERWHYYEQMAGVERGVPHLDSTTEKQADAAAAEGQS